MATSGVYSFGVTRDDVIRQAMLNIGKLDPFETPDSQQTSDFGFVLNMMCKQWMGKADFAPGLKVWTRKRGYLFLSTNAGAYTVGPGAVGWTNAFVNTTSAVAAGAGSVSLTLSSLSGVVSGYNLGIIQTDGSLFWTTISALVGSVATVGALPVGAAAGAQVYVYATAAQQPILIEAVVLRDSYNSDTPMNIMGSTQDYDFLPSKAQLTNQSDPSAIYYEFQLGNSNLYIDVGTAQDLTKYLVITYQEPVQDFTTSLDAPYYPQEWYLALCWGLSKLICPQCNRIWTPLMEENFKSALAIAGRKDPEISSLYFIPRADL